MQMNWLIIITIIIVIYGFAFVAGVIIPNRQYKKSAYYLSTHRTLASVKNNKGCYGEYLIYWRLRNYEKEGAKFLFNCYLPKANGETTEIDAIMIYRSGIYVFESKFLSGWIFGNEYDNTWTQTLPGKNEVQKNHFANPIMQNKGHIARIEELVGEKIPIHSIIVFSDKCTFKDLNVVSLNTYVVRHSWLFGYVKGIDEKIGPELSPEKINSIYNQLFPYTQVSDYEKVKHIYDILENQQEIAMHNTPLKAENGVSLCPLCGGKLVIRTAQRGTYAGSQFYGCSNYPQCKYIYNIK